MMTYKNTPKKWENAPKIPPKNGENTPKKWENAPKIPQKFGKIPQKFGKTPSIKHCNTDIYKDVNCREIIYIIFRNKLRNYRNRKNTPKFGGIGVFFWSCR